MEKLYLISYDLINNRNYQKLYDELESYGAVRILESTWYFKKANVSVNFILDHFENFIDSDDRLLVSQVDSCQGYNLKKSE